MSEMKASVSEPGKMHETIIFTLVRVAIGFEFLWAFLDKTFGFGQMLDVNGTPTKVGTLPADSWINGGSPTWGFLAFGTKGKFFEGFYSGLAGSKIIEFLFMFGLLGIGLAMFLGIGRRIAATCGIVMMALLWSASIPISTNPIIDDHIILILVFAVLGYTNSYGQIFIPQWEKVAEKYPFLR